MSDMSPERVRARNGQQMQRRNDYPEPLYIRPRAPVLPETPNVSPMTQHAASVVLQPHVRCPSPLTFYSREIDKSWRDSHSASIRQTTDEALRVGQVAQKRRDVYQSCVARDSGVGAEFELMQYGHPSYREPAQSGRDAAEHHAALMPAFGEAPSPPPPNGMFVFGQESDRNCSAFKPDLTQPPKSKRKRWSMCFRSTKAVVAVAAAELPVQDTAGEEAEMMQSRPSRLDRFRKSVSGIPKAVGDMIPDPLKQLAGHKRSREESEDSLDGQAKRSEKSRGERPLLPPYLTPRRPRGASMPLRVVIPPPMPTISTPTEPATPSILRGDVWPRAPGVLLAGEEMEGMMAFLALGPSAVGDGKAEEGPGIVWTEEKKVEFEAYVRVAEEQGGFVEVDKL